jgi:hypothetical protein
MENLTIQITVSKKTAIYFSVFMAVLIVMSTLKIADSTDAGFGKQMCVGSNGRISQKSKCSRQEKSIAPGRLITTPISDRQVKNGTIKMRKKGLSSVRGYSDSVSGIVVETTEATTNGVIAVTEKLLIPENWRGSYNGVCPDYAPIPIGWGMWSPELGQWNSLPFDFGVGVPTANFRNYLDSTNRPPFTVYVTQSCAPIIQYQPAP